MMKSLGYTEICKEGPRRRFFNEETKHVLNIHEPHGADAMRKFDLKRARKNLKEQGLF